ncbi:MAG: hypothetical protein WDO13_15120 [Verrucomicrobiota bacterium]
MKAVLVALYFSDQSVKCWTNFWLVTMNISARSFTEARWSMMCSSIGLPATGSSGLGC